MNWPICVTLIKNLKTFFVPRLRYNWKNTLNSTLRDPPNPFVFNINVTSKKSPIVYKSCPKMISLEKLKILTPLQKLPNNLGDLGKINYCQRFWKVAQSPINCPIWSHCKLILENGALYLVEGDEGSCLPNCQTNLVIALHVSIFLAFHKHNILPLGENEPSSLVSCHSPHP